MLDAATPQKALFFEREAKYFVDPGATPGQLLDDAQALMSFAVSILDDFGATMPGSFWGAMHLLRQSDNAVAQASRLLPKGDQS